MTQDFAADVREGLLSMPKKLPSKYFYDQNGDKLFQAIMGLEEYYLTRSEFEILRDQKEAIVSYFLGNTREFDLIELGAGDGTKTKILLTHLEEIKANFKYVPVDISPNVLDILEKDLSLKLPSLKVMPYQGDYFDALSHLQEVDQVKKVVLFLGSNIGNFPNGTASAFLKNVSANLVPGDMLFIGFDLMKDPNIILSAYNDSEGVTRDFNLNLLQRINDELGGNFDLSKFKHFPTYDPINGETKSHLISKVTQEVYIEAIGESFTFDAWEAVHTEVSQKYSLKDIHRFAKESGFRVAQNFTDSKGYYVDSLWEKI